MHFRPELIIKIEKMLFNMKTWGGTYSLPLRVLYCVLIPACFLVETSDSQTTACSGSLHSPQCLAALRQLLADEDTFWFGSRYNSSCNSPPASTTMACGNNDKQHLSIVTRMRGTDDNSTDSITQVLNVTYVAPAGSYEACGNTYEVEAVTKTIDPTRTTVIPFWSIDHVPSVSWTSTTNTLYTLFVWDSAAFVLHGLFYNIRGSKLDNYQVAWRYLGPKNPLDREQPYAILLYEQPGEIRFEDITSLVQNLVNPSNGIAGGAPYQIAGPLSLTGPVAASLLRVRTDLYGPGALKKMGILNLCPSKLTPKFAALPLSYNVSGVQLMTSVDVTFTSPEITFRSCCRQHTVAANSRAANPLGDGRISPVYARETPQVTLVPSNFGDTFYFMRYRYTLLLLDVTEELTQKTNPDTILHWQVVNMVGDVTSGQTTLPYQGPLPLTGGGDRTLLFLLLQQSSAMVNVSSLTRFTGDSCPTSLSHRCRFNLTAFMTELGMTVEGASWFVTSPDAYSRQQVVSANQQPETAACATVSSYSNPCQSSDTCSSGAGIVRLSFLVAGLSALWVLFLTA